MGYYKPIQENTVIKQLQPQTQVYKQNTVMWLLYDIGTQKCVSSCLCNVHILISLKLITWQYALSQAFHSMQLIRVQCNHTNEATISSKNTNISVVQDGGRAVRSVASAVCFD